MSKVEIIGRRDGRRWIPLILGGFGILGGVTLSDGFGWMQWTQADHPKDVAHVMTVEADVGRRWMLIGLGVLTTGLGLFASPMRHNTRSTQPSRSTMGGASRGALNRGKPEKFTKTAINLSQWCSSDTPLSSHQREMLHCVWAMATIASVLNDQLVVDQPWGSQPFVNQRVADCQMTAQPTLMGGRQELNSFSPTTMWEHVVSQIEVSQEMGDGLFESLLKMGFSKSTILQTCQLLEAVTEGQEVKHDESV